MPNSAKKKSGNAPAKGPDSAENPATPTRVSNPSAVSGSKTTPNPKPSPARKRSPINKTAFGAKTLSANERAKKEMMAAGLSRCNKIHTVATQDGITMVGLFTNREGKSAYMLPLKKWCEDVKNSGVAKDQAKCHKWFEVVNPHNNQTYKECDRNEKTGYVPRFQGVLAFLEEDKVHLNSSSTRARWASGIQAICNSPTIQTGGHKNKPGVIQQNNRLECGGDITPENRPYLTDYMTLGDVMETVAELYSTVDENTGDNIRLTDAEIVEDEELLNKFFAPSLHEKVRQVFMSGMAPHFNLPDLGF